MAVPIPAGGVKDLLNWSIALRAKIKALVFKQCFTSHACFDSGSLNSYFSSTVTRWLSPAVTITKVGKILDKSQGTALSCSPAATCTPRVAQAAAETLHFYSMWLNQIFVKSLDFFGCLIMTVNHLFFISTEFGPFLSSSDLTENSLSTSFFFG